MGLAADLVLFDPATVANRATEGEPAARPAGIDRVMVNGNGIGMNRRDDIFGSMLPLEPGMNVIVVTAATGDRVGRGAF